MTDQPNVQSDSNHDGITSLQDSSTAPAPADVTLEVEHRHSLEHIELNDETHLLRTRQRTWGQRAEDYFVGSQKRKIAFVVSLVFSAIVIAIAVWLAVYFTRPQPNLIIMVSDGWGPAGQTLARAAKGKDKSLFLDDLIVGTSHTDSSNSWVTDSAAGATAYSCGKKSYNGAVAVDPVTKKALGTLMEAAKTKGMATGFAVTCRVTHATPAAFTSHSQHRDYEEFIASQQVAMNIDVMFGGGLEYYLPIGTGVGKRNDSRNLLTEMKANGVAVATNMQEYLALKTAPCAALLSASHMDYEIDRDPKQQPSLLDMTTKALDMLQSKANGKGFVLLVEGSRIDMAAHSNDPAAMLHDSWIYDETVDGILTWIASNGGPQSNLVISVSDHETGGLTLGYQADYSKPSPYHWRPDFLLKPNASCSWMATQITYNSADINETLRVYGGVEDLTAQEFASVNDVRTSHQHTTYALAHIISSRAEVGWTTHGHTGVDINRYAFGWMSEMFKGATANDFVGRQLANTFMLDLGAITKSLAGVPTEPSNPSHIAYDLEHWW